MLCRAVLQEDDVEQELLLDSGVPPVGSGHGGALIELPLSYNLTGHTGSFMYMAPEVYNVSEKATVHARSMHHKSPIGCSASHMHLLT